MNMEIAMRGAERAFGVVLEASLLASVLIVLVALVQWIIGKRLGPSWRFALWGIVLVRLLLPIAPVTKFSLFNASPWFEQERVVTNAPRPPSIAPLAEEARSAEFVAEFGIEAGATAASSGPSVADMKAPIDVDGWMVASLVWLLGLSWFMARLVLGYLWVLWKLRGAEIGCGAEAAREILQAAARDLRTGLQPLLVETKLVSSPAVFGILQPRLLVPPEFSASRTERELRHIFLHELAHLKRADLITNSFMAIAQALHWMNPLVWLALRQMRVERELACDEMALRVIGRADDEPRAYGETILRLLEGVPVRRGLGSMVGIAEEKYAARKRLAQIAVYDSRRKRRGALGVLFVAVLGLCGLTNPEGRSAGFDGPDQLGRAAEAQTSVERLIKEAQTLMKAGSLDPARLKLNQARTLAPNHPQLAYYLNLLDERPSSIAHENPFVRTSVIASAAPLQVSSSKGRQAVLKKLQELRIDYYEVPNSLELSDVIKDLHSMARKLDPDHKGVNFVFSSHLQKAGLSRALAPAGGAAPLVVRDYLVTITPALRDVTLLGLLDAIMEVAVPPRGHEEAPRLRYSIEEFGVVFGQREPEREQLYTRTFKIDPNTFLHGLDLQFDQRQLQGADEPGRISRVQQAVRHFFVAAGLYFTSSQEVAVAAGGPPPPQRAIFYNDRTGILFVRATIRDLELVEQALQVLNSPAQLTISAEVVVTNPDELKELLGERESFRETRATVLTDPEYRGLKVKSGKRIPVIPLPRMTTLSGRPVSLESEALNLSAEYHATDKTFTVKASEFHKGKSKTYEGLIYDGQTFVVVPQNGDNLEMRRVVFITVYLIDAAGNKVNNDDEFIEMTSKTVPKKQR